MNAEESYARLGEMVGYPKSSRLRSVLEYMMTPDQARMVAALPGTAEEVAGKTGLSADQVRESLEELFFKGVVFARGDFIHRDYYRFARSVGQLHDASQASQKLDPEKDRKFYQLWHDFVMNEWYPDSGKRMAKAEQARSRVVPAYKSIKDLPGVMPCEDFREVLKAQERIAIVPCSCRYRTTSVGEQCEHTAEAEDWHCLQFGRGADYVLARGSGKELSQHEAMKLLDKIEEDGLLHIFQNNRNLTGPTVSCQCCRDCCMIYVPLDMVGASIGKAWEKSRYQAEVDADKCIGCQDCVDRCQFDAIEMFKPEAATGSKKSKKLKSQIDPDKCWGCGVCVVACEAGALTMKQVRPEEHIPAAAAS